MVSCVCKQGVTACSLLVSAAHGLPAKCFVRGPKDVNHRHGMRTAGRVVSNLPAIEPYPLTHPVCSVGPSAVRPFGRMPCIYQNWNGVFGIREFVTLFFETSLYNIKVYYLLQ